ncbi:MAG: S1 RNA-binding domain-containing protein [Epsilonproteobacteria bacterium]|nr:S1 RNA-binding domain-containing protein [Campylobacterota bacterium]OIO16284.1 MAG: RNA-binding protein [Helicobacteraceae bacterium CG1_02_36_14]PIP09543.1 MAG: RNA-binding protein [Sulfurimonas sp. CG23_combo_of_CG06-09_8_20_14_all_36_33]PIS24888.1 MAG: RNA-binding protein [Sulfurimonas sp. CG08_land_8_20_14_0_20_36_33]PIU33613.1 MAG: RNA-binding protein [Sulfurimonas sp. CG07_land_8_20_14_0_80_36_56]PIV05574.1 MAG: RNA-binding protein [Sulfurimonas sp. CG03_land_8_20_14_0_80_36_25]PIV3
MTNLISLLMQKTDLKRESISNILKLLDEGSTIPFIARYRKEMTGGASDETLRDFEMIYLSSKKLLERKEEISRLISERAVLSEALQKSIDEAESLRVLEDIYRPYKEKKSSRASVAIANGLTHLANTLQSAKLTHQEFLIDAKRFVKGDVTSVEEAIKGAQDILAERYAEEPRQRDAIRNSMLRFGLLETKKTKNFQAEGSFKNLADKSEKVAYIPSHRYLAIMRGVAQKELSAKIALDLNRIEQNIREYKIPRHAQSSKELLFEAYKDGLKRLLLPSIEREVQAELKERADLSAISVFGKNLNQLLMTPPVTKRVILGVDPAFVSGCKLAVIDENGNYLESAVIYPTEPKNDYANSKRKVLELTKKYNITGVAIGNGTGSRETQEFFSKLNAEENTSLSYTVVSEAGASVYSASKIAQEEYPNLDVTIRGAISIAGRLRDPMAALVKIDPKSLGIGQYQHDVDQKLLEKKLGDVTCDLVNRVGVDINSASASLLSHVAGIGSKIAKNILEYREKEGNFTSKAELLKVKGLGKKAYEQAAGFIRIKDGQSVFDNSGIHPESYAIAKKLEGLDLTTLDVAQKATLWHVGVETLRDIITELKKPGFDPREELPPIPFSKGLTDIKMLKEGSFVSGIVRNIADFGAFVDIGLKNDGMIHISKMSAQRVSHPLEVLSLNQYLPRIEVIAVDKEKGKVSLSLL